MMLKLNHNDLVVLAASWLRKHCIVVITEMAHGEEEADAIGFKSFESILIECKASRSDFLTDRKKSCRVFPETGLGAKRYYMVPKGLISVSDLPEKWGLIEVENNKTRVKIQPENFNKRHKSGEISLLVSALRRLGQNDVPGISVRHYIYTIEKPRATIGILDTIKKGRKFCAER